MENLIEFFGQLNTTLFWFSSYVSGCFFSLSSSSTAAAAAKSLQSCPTLCDPIDGSPPGSPTPGILQARTLEWVPFPSPMHESEKWKGSRSVLLYRCLKYWFSPGFFPQFSFLSSWKKKLISGASAFIECWILLNLCLQMKLDLSTPLQCVS